MKNWKHRVKEEANLLNPAFLAAIIVSVIHGYDEKKEGGLPYIYLFLIPSIVLHKSSRDLLPRSVSTSLFTWLYENQQVKVNFYSRAKPLKPYLREAFLFGLKSNAIELMDNGRVSTHITNNAVYKFARSESEETKQCLLKARFLGKWFANTGEVKTVLSLWGIRP